MAQAASSYLGEQRRRSTRLNQTLPITVRGVDLLGQPFEERTATQILSFHGCRYASKHHLPKNTWITIELSIEKDRKEQRCVRARVAWIQRPRTLRELFQVGVELETGANVWGIAFPPEDWTSTGVGYSTPTSMAKIAVPDATAETPEHASEAAAPGPLDAYIERVLAESMRGSAGEVAGTSTGQTMEESPLLRELHAQVNREAQKALNDARELAERLVEERAEQIRWEQRTTAEAFYQRWREEFEQAQSGAREEISSQLGAQVDARVVQAKKELRDSLAMDFEGKLERARAAIAEWEHRAESAREKDRVAAQEAIAEFENRVGGKIQQRVHDLQEEIAASSARRHASERSAEMDAELASGWRERLQSDMAVTRAQWNEILESSVDNAAQRVIGRLTEDSQRVLEGAEQTLAFRMNELTSDVAQAGDEARKTLASLEEAFEQKVSGARSSLGEIEQAAARLSEYSTQLEAASQDSLNELHRRLEAMVMAQTTEMERRGQVLLDHLKERAGPLLDSVSQQMISRTVAEAEAKIAPGLERVGEALRQLAAREAQAEEILRVHRERLRQISEQTQRETAGQLSSTLTGLREQFEDARNEALRKWAAELDAIGVRATHDASETMAQAADGQIAQARSQLEAQSREVLAGAESQLEIAAGKGSARFKGELQQIRREHSDAARRQLEETVEEAIAQSREKLAEAAEIAGAQFGQLVEMKSEGTLERFSQASESMAEQRRGQLGMAAEQTLHRFEALAKYSLEHFEHQVAGHMNQSLAETHQLLEAQLSSTLETLRRQGEVHVDEWMHRQERLRSESLGQYGDQIRATSDAWVASSLRRLDDEGRSLIEAMGGALEQAMRQTCIKMFDDLAQAMRDKLLDALEEMRPSAAPPPAESTPAPRHAQA